MATSGSTESVRFDPSLLYTAEDLRTLFKIERSTMNGLFRCGLRCLRTTPRGERRVFGRDFVEFLQQMAEHEGADNQFNPDEFTAWMMESAEKREAKRKRSQRRN